MNSLNSGPCAQTLQRLFKQAQLADHALMETHGQAPEEMLAQLIEGERRDLRGVYQAYAENYLNVSEEFGRFLYQCARACRAKRIVEFGTSMGISTLYLAAALRDMGGGELIGTELEPGKVKQARENVQAAGFEDLVQVREGDARETLKDLGGSIDLVLLDGAFSLYLPVLQLLEPYLRDGALILAENAFEQAGGYLVYVRDSANGYLSQPVALNEGRGNELTVRVRG